MPKKQIILRYFLSETHYFARDYSILIVTLVGPLTEPNVPIFQQCIEQISKSSAKWIIINFRDVPNLIDQTLVPSFRNLLSDIRGKSIGLRISGIHPHLKEVLEREGIAQTGELVNNFAEALDSLPTI